MEHIHGVDVSWMTHGKPQDKVVTRSRSSSQQSRPTSSSSSLGQDAAATPTSAPPPTQPESPAGNKTPQTSSPKPTTPIRPGFTRTASAEKTAPPNGGSSPRRGSWFSSISSKLSGAVGASTGGGNSTTAAATTGQSSPQPSHVASPTKSTITISGDPPVPRANPVKNAVLPHAAKHDGDGPYTPAPPRSSQAGLLHVLRRLSSASSAGVLGGGGNGGGGVKAHNHGLVDRRVMNVDRHRERCPISELNQANLRRVAFCVDVEIAPMPKYAESDTSSVWKFKDKTQKRKMAEKAEGDALKHPRAAEEQKEQDGVVKEEKLAAELEKAAVEGAQDARDDKEVKVEVIETKESAAEKGGDNNKKKEKKKKSEGERKARKERKRRLAEANGMIPMEIYVDSDSSTSGTADEPKSTTPVPTTNPVRIYRRCCQLRETPILKKITEQLLALDNVTARGLVEKLDLTGYWMQLPDLITLGDYLAIVPVKELVLENCGLTDEGLRVILAGLLAAKKPEAPRKRKLQAVTEPDELAQQGGVTERLVLKKNKLTAEGWKHICLFLFLCRSLKFLDVSSIAFPQPAPSEAPPATEARQVNGTKTPLDLCSLLAKSIGGRLAGSTLELLNFGDTGITSPQLGHLIDGMIQCGLKRLGLANNNLDIEGVQHVARYLKSGKCEGLDISGNDLCDQLGVLASAISETDPLYALSLADCNLKTSSLCKLFPVLGKLPDFRFIDLSHNGDLFALEPSALSVLRRYLPKMAMLKRIHLTDCSVTPEQAISLAEILPEVPSLANINLLENPELSKLADAQTEEAQEEACALYASLLAATRVSKTIIRLDVDVPTERSSEIVKAMAKQVVAYCLTNMERWAVPGLVPSVSDQTETAGRAEPGYPDVLQHLVGHDVLVPDEPGDADDAAPDDDYVIGGTGIVKALTFCLKNRGDDSRRQSGELTREAENGPELPKPRLPTAGKAKDMSKHLLSGARKIRQRLQPALAKAKAASDRDQMSYHRLLFLDNTIQDIIKRFEDEFPETREAADSGVSTSSPTLATSLSSAEAEAYQEAAAAASEGEEETEVKTPASLSRNNSIISSASKALADEEGRALRAGHKWRSSVLLSKPQLYAMLSSSSSGGEIEDMLSDPRQQRVLQQLLEELDDEELRRMVAERGIVSVFSGERERIFAALRGSDPDHWERFVESQAMAAANRHVDADADADAKAETVGGVLDEVAVDDDEDAVEDGLVMGQGKAAAAAAASA